jgi:hypothetical protein
VTFNINRHTQKVEWYLKTSEVCALAKILREDDNLFKAHFKVAKEEILRLIGELDSEALQAILRKEEPQTVKIGEDDLPAGTMEKLGLSYQNRRLKH